MYFGFLAALVGKAVSGAAIHRVDFLGPLTPSGTICSSEITDRTVSPWLDGDPVCRWLGVLSIDDAGVTPERAVCCRCCQTGL